MSDAKQLLRQYGLQPKKTWGQNFLVKQRTIDRIVDALAPTEDDTVVELGAGTGALTFRLVERAGQLYAIERDRELAAVLRQELQRDNFTLIEADAARFSLEEIAQAEAQRTGQAQEPPATADDGTVAATSAASTDEPAEEAPKTPSEAAETPSQGELLVIGNLPYQITAPILFHLLDERHLIRRAVLMVQKEVADRLVATPKDGKDYSILSVLFGAHFAITRAIQVSRNNFYPKPRVDSTVVKLETREEPLVPIADQKWFTRTVKIAFAQRRKTLLNNLKAGFPTLGKEALASIMEELDLDLQCRGETLDIAQFAALAEALQRQHETTEAS